MAPLIPAKFIKRYKRFFVDAKLENGEVVTAHTNNTGSMMGLLEEGRTVYLQFQDDPKRKLKYSFEMVDIGTSLVGVNTNLPNKLVSESIAANLIPELSGYETLKREVKYGKEGKSRIDVLLTSPNKPPCYVEVKNVTLAENNVALFPDAVTTRGLKHLEELIEEVQHGNRAVMFYLVQREDCTSFAPAKEIDINYTKKLREAVQLGVEVLVYSCKISPNGIELDKPLPTNI